MIRITGGRCRGRPLPAPVPASARPTAARVREALFNVLGNDLEGRSFLDLFGGSGLVALEAASRGAAPVVVVERDPRAAAAIRANAVGLGLPLEVRVGDAAHVRLDPADVVFVDPPYREPVARWLARAAALAREVLVVEHARGADAPAPPGFRADRPRAYGDTVLQLHERVGPDAGGAEAQVVGEDGPVVEHDG